MMEKEDNEDLRAQLLEGDANERQLELRLQEKEEELVACKIEREKARANESQLESALQNKETELTASQIERDALRLHVEKLQAQLFQVNVCALFLGLCLRYFLKILVMRNLFKVLSKQSQKHIW